MKDSFSFNLANIKPSDQIVTKYMDYLVHTYVFLATIWISPTADSNRKPNAFIRILIKILTNTIRLLIFYTTTLR